MAVYMIERNFAEQLKESDVNADLAAHIKEANDDANVRWLVSFLSADRKKSFCLYEAENPDAIQAAAEAAGLPADVIIEVGDEILPTGMASALAGKEYAK